MARVVIDPVTRIEGHLRVEIEVEGGKVKDAWASGGLYRGMETVLLDRAPEDAFYIAQRICGVCPVSHGHASTMAAESALKISIPNNARIIRNIIEGAEALHSHILWFYTLTALDYVDVTSALKADIGKTYDLAKAAGTRPADFKAIQERLKQFVEGGKLSIFTQGWWGHPTYKLPPELNLIAVAHYLEALTIQGDAAEIIAIMGGKFPHFMTSIPGGTAWVPTEEKLGRIVYRLSKVKAFIDEAMIPDTLAIAPYYKDALGYGAGVKNFLSWGVYEDASGDPKKRFLPRGAIYGAKGLSVVEPKVEQLTEDVEHSWYKPDETGLNPTEGKTHLNFTEYNVDKQYSYVKAPRMNGEPMEAGPLSRMLVAYLSGNEAVKGIIDATLAKLGAAGKPEVLLSLLGRVAARNLEAKVVADQMVAWVNELVGAIKGGDSKYFETERESDGSGQGLWEAPRGALGHFMTVKGGKISGYQVITPSTWDMSPRDKDGKRGPLEEALIGAPIEDVEKPMEALRIVHSFDP